MGTEVCPDVHEPRKRPQPDILDLENGCHTSTESEQRGQRAVTGSHALYLIWCIDGFRIQTL